MLKVKAMYQRLLREEGVDEGNVQVHDNSQHELAEGAAGKEQVRHFSFANSFIKSVCWIF